MHAIVIIHILSIVLHILICLYVSSVTRIGDVFASSHEIVPGQRSSTYGSSRLQSSPGFQATVARIGHADPGVYDKPSTEYHLDPELEVAKSAYSPLVAARVELGSRPLHSCYLRKEKVDYSASVIPFRCLYTVSSRYCVVAKLSTSADRNCGIYSLGKPHTAQTCTAKELSCNVPRNCNTYRNQVGVGAYFSLSR
jgi:hypothetical protein